MTELDQGSLFLFAFCMCREWPVVFEENTLAELPAVLHSFVLQSIFYGIFAKQISEQTAF